MNGRAILIGHDVVPCDDLMTWATIFERDKTHVGNTTIGEARISTVFLGLDHSFGSGPPLWFETMIFGGPLNDECWRYTTYAEAEAGHAVAIEKVKNAMPFAEPLA